VIIHAVFAPDWRDGVPYQRLLAEALASEDVNVDFLRGYKRVLPLARLLGDWQRSRPCDVLHLHWPEAYYPRLNDGRDWFRRMRFSPDLRLATRHCRLVITAHNLHAHNRGDEPFAKYNTRAAFQRASAVIAHSPAAKERIAREYQTPPERIHVIPHGDLSVVLPPAVPQADSRKRLELPSGRICLIFGAVEPYKGLEEVLAWWKQAPPGITLVIAGKPITDEYRAKLEEAAAGIPNVVLRFGWLDDEQLTLWLSACDVVLFNYREIFTSGAASLARSWGVPILLPHRLVTVDLEEPHPSVIRFDSPATDLGSKLQEALKVSNRYEDAAPWRASTGWARIAQLTRAAYNSALSDPAGPGT
jgi:glycosyltransferase involved in cell wall biosynthesis